MSTLPNRTRTSVDVISRPSSPIVLDSGSGIKSECSVLFSPVSYDGWSLSVSSLVLVSVYIPMYCVERCIATGYARAKNE